MRLYGNRAGPPRRDPALRDPALRDPAPLGGLEISHINALPGLARLSGLSVTALFTRILYISLENDFSIDFNLKMCQGTILWHSPPQRLFGFFGLYWLAKLVAGGKQRAGAVSTRTRPHLPVAFRLHVA